MVGREVEGFEIVEVGFDFGAFRDGVAQGPEDLQYLLEREPDRVCRAQRASRTGQGGIHSGIRSLRGGRALRRLLDGCLEIPLEQVLELADGGFEFSGCRLQPAVVRCGQQAVAAAQPPVAN